MNKILISNPFLFPPSGDNEEEKELFQVRADIIRDYIKYSFEEFEKAWKEEEHNTPALDEGNKGNLFPLPLSSPTVTSTDFDDTVMDFNASYLEDYALSPMFENADFDELTGFEKGKSNDGLQESNEELLRCTDSALTQLNDTMFPATNNLDTEKQNQDFMSSQGSNLSGMSETWLNLNFGLLEQITANDPDPPMSSSTCVTVNPVEIQHTTPPVPIKQEVIAPIITAPVKIEPVSSSANRPSRQRRKSVQQSRNVQDSPMMFAEEQTVDLQAVMMVNSDVKPFALATINGSRNRTRNISASSSTSMAAASSSAKSRKESQERRKRKYEEEDDNDPSVKNAKAAKMNREKKKQQLNTLQTENNTLKNRVQQLEQENEELQTTARLTEHQKSQEIESLQQQLAHERSKNSANSFHHVRLLDHITNIIRAVHPQPQVFVTDRLADLPAPTSDEIADVRRRMREGNESSLQSNESSSTYLTVKAPNFNLD
ncbi:unnamed protein product [Orchesella dallaii]|uniref:BZIP domain-containing protein n=1 Tax=Orchesella dallaii TaxID=48710 RepID=A0ABP1QSM6_9HEXA